MNCTKAGLVSNLSESQVECSGLTISSKTKKRPSGVSEKTNTASDAIATANATAIPLNSGAILASKHDQHPCPAVRDMLE